jgi:hypothetical protein
MTTTLTPAEVLALHQEAWDMPTLNREHPEAIAWISERVLVDFDMASQVVIVDRATGAPTFHETSDVRVAVRTWLIGLDCQGLA